MRGADVLLEVLRAEGVTKIFGNPGTTELPLIDALARYPEIEYVLALQEASAVAMADGYAQVTRRPAFVNLHTAGGLGHGMGNILNAVASCTPLVVTAGQQDQRHRVTYPLLGANLTAMASSVAKWTHEVTDISEIPIVVRRAFQDAMAAPRGIVFLSLPMDVMDQVGLVDPGRRSLIERSILPPEVTELADLVASYEPGRLALLAGDDVVAGDSTAEVIALAETLGTPVFGSSWPAVNSFPPAHPLWMGNLPTKASEIAERLSKFDAIFALGGKSLITILYTEGPVVPENVEIIHLSSNPLDLGRTYYTRLGVTGDIAVTLSRLLQVLEVKLPSNREKVARVISSAQKRRACELTESRAHVEARYKELPIPPMVAAYEMMRAIPPETLIVDEALSATKYVRMFHRSGRAGDYRFFRGGGLGWGMPAAVGCCLGLGRKTTVCVMGDGAAMYSPQALWSAANQKLPIVFVIMNNREYNVLKNFMREQKHYISAQTRRFIGMDLTSPPIDYVSLAQSMGLKGTRIESASMIADAVAAAIKCAEPALIEIAIGCEDSRVTDRATMQASLRAEVGEYAY
jgi:benzoylformate decarboxylase